MDFDDPKARAVFFDVHRGLPREGPGSRESTRHAVELAGTLPPSAKVLDIACGPGMQTMDLAELLPGAEIIAVDFHAPFVEEANRRAVERGVDDRVHARVGDMRNLDLAPDSFDLIWCEGAAYIMGVGEALRAWRPLLKAGGRLALTDAVWLRDDPPPRVARCWAEYPDMRDTEQRRALVAECGYRLLGDFVLPLADWLDDYADPQDRRINEIAPKYVGDPVAEAVLEECREETAVFRAFPEYFGYLFLVMARD